MRPETLAVHAGGEPDAATGALSPPLHLSTTFAHGPAGERVAGYEYTREGNPTQDRFEAALAAMEGGAAALAFASGMAAMNAVLEAMPAGAEVLIPADCYTGLRVLGAEFMPERGVRLRAVEFGDLEALRAAMTPATKLLWAETPSNPQLRVADLAALAQIAHAGGALLACDNTFATPALQNPIAHGADVVMHSTTKYLGGHSDVLGGALVFARSDELHAAIAHRRHVTGAVANPFGSWLTLRGCRSLHARMALHCANARRVAEFLDAHPAIEVVHYPGLPSHPNHAVAATQMRDFGGLMSVQVHGGRAGALAFASRLKLITNATSLGGCESLVEHRASVEGPKPFSPDNLLRMSIGLEHIDDLLEDLREALG
jgi:cystathionine gamma-synthase